MFLERRQPAGKWNRQGAVVGYDFGRRFVQISFCAPGESKPETVSQTAGGEEYLIPALLARQEDRELWLYGGQAREAAEKGEAIPVTDLLLLAARGEEVTVGEQSYDPIRLLSLFLRRTLSLLTPFFPSEKLQAFVFTVEEVTRPVIDALMSAFAMLECRDVPAYVIGRAESFFYYNISQPRELWKKDVMVCDLGSAYLKTLRFHLNEGTTPMACFVQEDQKEEIGPFVPTGDELEDRRGAMRLDRAFAGASQKMLEDGGVSTIYLIGEGFEGEWYQESLPVLCGGGRRVFLGNNLYSKGACYAASQRLLPEDAPRQYAFLGKDMLKNNLGMRVSRQGRDAYLALFDAGINWYDAQRECEFLLGEKNEFTLRITPLDGKEIREVQMALDGLPKRPPYTTRIRMKVRMQDPDTVHISMEDLGFGEFFAATHRFWEESIRL